MTEETVFYGVLTARYNESTDELVLQLKNARPTLGQPTDANEGVKGEMFTEKRVGLGWDGVGQLTSICIQQASSAIDGWPNGAKAL